MRNLFAFITTLLLLWVPAVSEAQWNTTRWLSELWNNCTWNPAIRCETASLVTDWTSAMTAVYLCETGAGTAVPDATGVQGDLVDTGIVSRGTTNPPEGTRYCDFDGINDVLSCTDASCALDLTGNAYTIAAWYQMRADVTDPMIFKISGDAGYSLEREPIFDGIMHTHGDGAPSPPFAIYTVTTTVNTWIMTAAVYNNTDALIACRKSSSIGCPGGAGTDANLANTAVSLTVGSDGTAFAEMFLDELIFDDVQWTAEEFCRICSCNLDGALCMGNGSGGYLSCSSNADCRKNGNTEALCDGTRCTGRNINGTLNCTSCVMAASNAAAP